MSCEDAFAVRKSTGISLRDGSSRSMRQSSIPLIFGRFQSRTRRSNSSDQMRCSASSALAVGVTTSSTASSIAETTSRMSASSSTTRTRAPLPCGCGPGRVEPRSGPGGELAVRRATPPGGGAVLRAAREAPALGCTPSRSSGSTSGIDPGRRASDRTNVAIRRQSRGSNVSRAPSGETTALAAADVARRSAPTSKIASTHSPSATDSPAGIPSSSSVSAPGVGTPLSHAALEKTRSSCSRWGKR